MGRPKGLLELDGLPLLRAHVDAYLRAGLPVTVVLGRAAREYVETLPKHVRIIFNLAWARTEMTHSAAMGLAGAGDALLTPVDAPPVRADTLARLLAADGPAVPTWNGLSGHPVRLCAPHPAERLDLRLAAATRVPVDDPDCVRNLNRPEEWDAWLEERRRRLRR
jgi:CTP:molybdopterin cytidylyltransferase MocA